MTEKSSHPDLEPILNLDPAIHSRSRLMILAYLASVKNADFTFLLNQTRLTRGNLATHLGKLEEAGFIQVKKEFVDRIPRSLYQLTSAGKDAIQDYRSNMRQVIDQLLGEV